VERLVGSLVDPYSRLIGKDESSAKPGFEPGFVFLGVEWLGVQWLIIRPTTGTEVEYVQGHSHRSHGSRSQRR
jgi:hypothetical protein